MIQKNAITNINPIITQNLYSWGWWMHYFDVSRNGTRIIIDLFTLWKIIELAFVKIFLAICLLLRSVKNNMWRIMPHLRDIMYAVQ